MFITSKFNIAGPFEPTWINHRWHYHGNTYRSLRNLKSRYSYKLECQLAKTLAEDLRKEIDKEIMNTLIKDCYAQASF